MRGSAFAHAASAAIGSIILLVAVGIVHADSIFTSEQVVHGRVIGLDDRAIVLRLGCSDEEKVFSWSVAKEVVFNDRCEAPPLRLPSAGGGACSSPPVRRFAIYFHGQEAPVLADAVQLTADGTLHYDDRHDLKQGHGPVAEVRGIARRAVCNDDAAQLQAPAAFCVEDTKFAANFSNEAPLANKILTRGFSFHLQTIPPTAHRNPELTALIRDGFGTALTAWTSELWRRKAEYDESLLNLLDGMVSRSSSGYVMFLPPQVIALECPDSANFIVKVHLAPQPPFERSAAEIKAAFAAKPGRTILLNFVDYPCWRHANFSYVIEKESRCINVVPILIHELGHAFGLGHVDEDQSIMTEIVYRTDPSVADLERLAAQLVRSVDGPAPGIIEFVADAGVAVE